MRFRRNFILMLILGVLATTIISCGGDGNDENVMTVLAGSELKDLAPLMGQIKENTGLTLRMEYVGTLDGAERLMTGEKVDLAWFSHGKYISLLQGDQGRIAAQEKIMLSPVVLGVKESVAEEWGWIDDSVTWQNIKEKASSGELRYAMTNPASSNSGFTALVGVAAALSSSGGAIEVADVDNEALQEFFKGQVLTAGSSGWLAESYVAEQEELNGIINYESVLLALNESGQLQEELYLVYPQEGIITADYPLMLFNGNKREQYQKLVDYLRTPEFQQQMMDQTLRRPAIPQVKPNDKFPNQVLVELPFPNTLNVINELLIAYLDEQRIPSHAIFVLDVSGSMEGGRLSDLKTSLTNLTGVDESITGQFARFRNRERITMITFNDMVKDISDFEINETASNSQSMEQIRTYANGLEAYGGTAIYEALKQAYTLGLEAKEEDPNRYYSIVLMSDGEYTDGIGPDEFRFFYNDLPPEGQQIKTFPILFGNADKEEMQEVAILTGGRVFDGQKEPLSFIFKQIRGYQ